MDAGADHPTKGWKFRMKGRDDSLMRLGWIDINPIRMHHKDMRTTLTIDDDVLKEAVKRAEALRISLGQALSDLASGGWRWAPRVKVIGGLVVFAPPRPRPRFR